jgi:hypothetical protein
MAIAEHKDEDQAAILELAESFILFVTRHISLISKVWPCWCTVMTELKWPAGSLQTREVRKIRKDCNQVCPFCKRKLHNNERESEAS